MASSSSMFTLALFFSSSFLSATSQQPCSAYHFPNNNHFAACNDLPVLESSLFWNYHPSTGTVDIAFKKSRAKSSNWIAWAINPTSKDMVGSQALIAFQRSDATLAAYPSPITSYGTQLQQGNLSFPVHGVSATRANGDMIIFGTLELPGNSTVVNHLWQEGPVSNDDTPRMHALSEPNMQSFGTIDFVSGKVLETDSGRVSFKTKTMLRNAHGILNGLSWGLLMPIGAILARYLKFFNGGATWFHLHVTCQCVAYLLGMFGYGTGLYFWIHNGSLHRTHGCIGITLACLATAQVLVGRFLRPNKENKHRILWNIFHHVVGYGTIALSISNVFQGLSIFDSYQRWKNAYVGILVALGALVLVLEAFSWFLVLKKKKEESGNSKTNIGSSPSAIVA